MGRTSVPVGKYLLLFTAVYTLAIVALTVTLQFVDFNARAMSVAAFIAAISFPANRFAQDHNRVPTGTERLKFAVGSVLIATAISLIQVAIVFALLSSQSGANEEMEALRQVMSDNSGILVFFIIFISVLYLGVAFFIFRWMAGTALKAAERRKSGS